MGQGKIQHSFYTSVLYRINNILKQPSPKPSYMIITVTPGIGILHEEELSVKKSMG